jgi:hypothetical protein
MVSVDVVEVKRRLHFDIIRFDIIGCRAGLVRKLFAMIMWDRFGWMQLVDFLMIRKERFLG